MKFELAMKFEIGTYKYTTWSTGREYKVEITEIKNGYAYCIIDDSRKKSFKIYKATGGWNDGMEYIEFKGKCHDALTPSDIM